MNNLIIKTTFSCRKLILDATTRHKLEAINTLSIGRPITRAPSAPAASVAPLITIAQRSLCREEHLQSKKS
eukprot:805966-Amphidinium_carterae.1